MDLISGILPVVQFMTILLTERYTVKMKIEKKKEKQYYKHYMMT